MKYKNIGSALHNFGHSFMSMLNYVDGDYAIDLLKEAVKSSPDHRLEIHFPGQQIEPPADYAKNLRKSVGYWADALPGHMERNGISADAVPELVLVVYGDASGVHCRVRATDDRGTEHDVLVTEGT